MYVAPAAYSCRPECHTHVRTAGPTESQTSGWNEHAVVFRLAELVASTHTWTTWPDGGHSVSSPAHWAGLPGSDSSW